MLDAADAEIEQAGLPLETLENDDSTSHGMRRVTLLAGIPHSMPKSAQANTLFEIPEFFFTSGAGAVRKRGAGLEPLSTNALRLLIKLLSEQDLDRYGGVCPAAVAFRNGGIVFGNILADWDDDERDDAVNELEDRGFFSNHPSTISRLD